MAGRTRKIILLSVILVLAPATVAWAVSAWQLPAGTGSASALADTLGTISGTPTASVSGRDVTLTWNNATLAASYTVSRTNTASLDNTTGGACATPPTASPCTDSGSGGVGLPENGTSATSWTFTITPKDGNWTQTGASTAAISVPAPSATTPSTVAAGGTFNASVLQFFDGEGITYHLDSSSGTTLGTGTAGTLKSPADGTNGAATTSLTMPMATSLGNHTVVAVGASGSTATSGTINVTGSPTVLFPSGSDLATSSSTITTDVFHFSATHQLTCSRDNQTAANCPTGGTTDSSGNAVFSWPDNSIGDVGKYHTLKVSDGTHSATVTYDVGPVPTGLFLENGSTNANQIGNGDTIVVTWSDALNPATICPTPWATSVTTLTTLTMEFKQVGQSPAQLTPKGNICGPGNALSFDSIDLGSATAWGGTTVDFSSSSVTYCSAHGSGLCADSNVQGPSIVIQLGGGNGTAPSLGTAAQQAETYTPSASIKNAGGLAATAAPYTTNGTTYAAYPVTSGNF